MPRPRSSQPAGALESIPHRAARIEDSYHDFRERRARKRGLVATVIPYTGFGGTGWVRVLGRVLLVKPVDGADDTPPQFRSIRGWRSFTSVPVNDVEVTITAGGVDHVVKADRGGVVDTVVTATLPTGWNIITMRTAEADAVEASVFIVADDVRVGLLSDIDDTIMVTALPRPFLAAWNTFVLDEHARRPVAGMAVLYERLARERPGAPVIYLSTGAWNVAPTLGRFLSRHLYPTGAMLLTDWGPTHDRWFRSGQEHKRDNLRSLASSFPNVKWLLIGDDGQHDEEIYAEFASEHETNVLAICIRQLSTSEAVLAGGRSRREALAESSRVPWFFAPDGAGLAEQLAAARILTDD